MNNKKREWLNLLEGNKNYNVTEFNNTVIENWCDLYRDNISAGLMVYRHVLLKKMDTPNFTENFTVQDIQQWFLQPITKLEFKYIKELMQKNYWTIEELWTQCKHESIGIMTLVKCLNENMKFMCRMP